MRIRELDSLRGIAATLVVLAHFSNADGFRYLYRFSLAQIPVLVFFGLSAFLLCYLCERRFDIRNFIASRIFRIVPLYLLVVAITLTVASLDPYAAKDELTKNTIAKLWLIVGFTFNWDLIYGDNGTLTEIRHLWSLCVEMQFYLVIAIAFPWLRKLRAWQAIAGALVVGTTFRFLTLGPPFQYTNSFSHIEVFAFSGIAGVAAARGVVLQVRVWPYALSLLAIGFVWQKVLPKPEYQYLSGLFYPVIGAIIAISLPNLKSKVLALPALAAIGQWSYGIYLWHFPVRLFVEPFASGPYTFFVLYIALTFVIAYVTYRLVERPINEWRHRHFRARVKPRLHSASVALAP